MPFLKNMHDSQKILIVNHKVYFDKKNKINVKL